MYPWEDVDSFEWLMFYLSQPNADQWQQWALLRTAVQANPKLATDSTLQNQWKEQVVSCTSQDALDLWEPDAKLVGGEITVSSVLTVLSAVGDPHQRIYGKVVTLSRCGIDIRGRSRKLRINY